MSGFRELGGGASGYSVLAAGLADAKMSLRPEGLEKAPPVQHFQRLDATGGSSGTMRRSPSPDREGVPHGIFPSPPVHPTTATYTQPGRIQTILRGLVPRTTLGRCLLALFIAAAIIAVVFVLPSVLMFTVPHVVPVFITAIVNFFSGPIGFIGFIAFGAALLLGTMYLLWKIWMEI